MFSKNHTFIYLYAFALFVCAALYGFLLRYNFIFPIQLNYQNVLQGHSHVAFLGWGYITTVALVLHYFVPAKKRANKRYKITVGICLLSITLMLVSFPLSGYKTFSIVLLSVFGITSYVLSFQLLKDIKLANKKNTATKLINYGVYYYLLSSLATWGIAFIVVTQGKTDLYYNAVYFYLHFLYNGYFVFVLFGLLFKLFANQKIQISEAYKKGFFVYLNAACIPAYALSVLWSNVPAVFYVIAFIAAVLQFFSLLFLLKILQQVFAQFLVKQIFKVLLKFALAAYGLKIVFQILSAFPFFVDKSISLKPYFIIGYLHLFTLAFMSVFILFMLHFSKKITFNTKVSKAGLLLFLSGVTATEALLFLQGFLVMMHYAPLPYYNMAMLLFSFLMLLGLLFVFTSCCKKSA